MASLCGLSSNGSPCSPDAVRKWNVKNNKNIEANGKLIAHELMKIKGTLMNIKRNTLVLLSSDGKTNTNLIFVC